MTPQPVYLITPKAAERLGVGTSTLRRWAKAGHVRHTVMPSGRLRFAASDLDACIARRGPDSEVGAA